MEKSRQNDFFFPLLLSTSTSDYLPISNIIFSYFQGIKGKRIIDSPPPSPSPVKEGGERRKILNFFYVALT